MTAADSTLLTDESIGSGSGRRRPLGCYSQQISPHAGADTRGATALRPDRAPDELDRILRRGPGREHLGDAELLELLDVVGGDRAANREHHIVHPLLTQQLEDPRHQRHVRAGEDRQPDRVGVLLDHGLDNLLGRLVKPRVDHLHPRVAKRAGDDLGAAVVPVEAGLGYDDADLLVSAGGHRDANYRSTMCLWALAVRWTNEAEPRPVDFTIYVK